MTRAIASIVAGLVTWIVVATLLNLLMRAAWPGYVAAEGPMTFSLGMLVARLLNGALSSLGAGFAAAWIAKGFKTPVKVLAIVLLLAFIPVHYGLWDKFPIGYHLVFLASLIPFTWLGAMARTRTAARTG